jgi:hypothetical protein
MPPKLIVSGPSLSQELVYNNTLLGLVLDDVTPTAALTALLFDGWTIGTVDPLLSNVSARFDGVPIFNAIAKIADLLGVHVRELSGRRIDLGAFGVASGITLMAPNAAGIGVDDNPLVGLIQSIKVTEEGTAIVNRIIPCGSGEGSTLFQLGPTTGAAAGIPWSTRTVPYTIHHAIGPNGETYYYLEDAASVAAYGLRIKVLAAKDIAPIANTPTAWENGANALYDLGATYLTRFKDPLKVYKIQVSKLDDAFEVGDTVRVIYRGVAVTDVATRTTWLNVDANLVVLEKTRSFDASGAETWTLVVATVARYLQDDQEILIGALETLRAFKTAIKFYTFESNHGTERDSIVSGHNFDYTVEYDTNVSYLHKVMLYAQLRGLKSNVTGGSAGGSHYHRVDLKHDHDINASTAGDSPQPGGAVSPGGHSHYMFGNKSYVGPYSAAYALYAASGKSFIVGDPSSGDFFTDNPSTITLVSPIHHTHPVNATTTQEGGDDDKTTSVNTNHTHALVYGIYESTVPASPGVQVWINGVNRTLALGGGGGFGVSFDVDISAYMVDADGHPLRAKNTVSLRTANVVAFDLIVQVRSFLSASAIEAS